MRTSLKLGRQAALAAVTLLSLPAAGEAAAAGFWSCGAFSRDFDRLYQSAPFEAGDLSQSSVIAAWTSHLAEGQGIQEPQAIYCRSKPTASETARERQKVAEDFAKTGAQVVDTAWAPPRPAAADFASAPKAASPPPPSGADIGLNQAITARNAEITKRAEAAQAAYAAQVAAFTNAQADYATQSAAAQAARAKYEVELGQWEAKVQACAAGKVAECAANK